MAVNKATLFCLLFVFKTIGDVECGCRLSLKSDFSTPSPVFLRDNQYLRPDSSGAVSVPRSGTLVVACPGDKRFIVLGNTTTSYHTMEAHCIVDTTFRVDRWIGRFNEIRCNRGPYFEAQLSPRSCLHDARIYEVGYRVNRVFYPLYEVCFNKGLLTTHYVKHEILPTSLFLQGGGFKASFIEGDNDMFENIKMSDIYKMNNQKIQFDAILGGNMSEKYISKNQFLNRGHLAARADFTLQAEQRASYHYANAAPQWRRGNAGDWAALEDALRRRVRRLSRGVRVYTGTHGALALDDARGVRRAVYLHADRNGNQVLPVPMYFYKLVYDGVTKTATAFLSINSSYYNSTEIKALTFCPDLCSEAEFSWLKWRPNDGTHSFCCDYDDFRRKIGEIEKLDVDGTFY